MSGHVSYVLALCLTCVRVCVCAATLIKQEIKAEPTQAPPPTSNTDLVTVAITLNPIAAQVSHQSSSP